VLEAALGAGVSFLAFAKRPSEQSEWAQQNASDNGFAYAKAFA
jgi:hypothetical protein